MLSPSEAPADPTETGSPGCVRLPNKGGLRTHRRSPESSLKLAQPAPGDGALDPSREGPAGPPQPAGRTPGMAMCGACTSLALKAHLLPHSLGCRTPRLQEGSEQGYPERMAVRTRPARPVPTLIRCCHKVCAPGQVSGPRSPGTSPSPSLWFGRCALDTPPNARPVLL